MSQIKIGLIGGSGLGDLIRSKSDGVRHDLDTPFGKPSDSIVEADWEGVPVFLLPRHGPGHLFGPTQVPFRANIFALKQLGCTHIIASGAVGSLRDEFKPRDLVIADQIIDKTSKRAATFFEKAAVHVEFAEPFCPLLRHVLIDEGRKEGSGFGEIKGSGFGVQGSVGEKSSEASRQSSQADKQDLHASSPEPRTLNPEPSFHVHSRGCYVCMEGPAFSTRAESLMHRLWGGDLIGMTAMPEAKLAREAEISYALVALVTDYDCWRKAGKKGPAVKEGAVPPPELDPAVLLKEIIANLQAASDNAMTLIRRVVQRIARNPHEVLDPPAAQALKLAIWSDKTKIPAEEVERLRPLWMKYFGN